MAYGRWSLKRGGRTWRFNCIFGTERQISLSLRKTRWPSYRPYRELNDGKDSIKPLFQITPKAPLPIKLTSPSNVLEIEKPPPPPPPRSYQRTFRMVNDWRTVGSNLATFWGSSDPSFIFRSEKNDKNVSRTKRIACTYLQLVLSLASSWQCPQHDQGTAEQCGASETTSTPPNRPLPCGPGI